ncbi:MAG TPA: glutamyl-tRNA reductase, partial [Iamia sp.]|nr:glutamyl-tRNA reductase [Iamia sp.]
MPLDLFERFTFDGTRAPKVLGALASCDHVSEAVLVSTCNRTEAYIVAERFHAAYQEVRDVLAELAHVAPEDFTDHLYVHYDDEAVRHLFRVVAGIDSDVLGDTEVHGQVRAAWAVGVDEGTVGPSLNLLFRHAVETGKRARTDTGIATGTASVSHAAVEMAAERLGTVAGRTVLVIGAGTIGRSMATALKGAGAARVLVANRTAEKAAALAADIDGEVVPLSQLDSALAECDVLLTSTGATSVIIDHTELETALERRDSDPLLVVDVAVPRDVDPGVADLEGVTLLDL